MPKSFLTFSIVLVLAVTSGYSWIVKPSTPARLFARASSHRSDIEFLGSGEKAVVRPGVCIVAPPEEANHFLNDAAIFIYAMGEDEEERFVIRGVILDMPTPFVSKCFEWKGIGLLGQLTESFMFQNFADYWRNGKWEF